MNSIQTIAFVTAGSGLFIFLLAIPLILGRVPPNAIYGIRTRASFASESEWYRINRIGGRYLAVSGLIILFTGMAGFFLPVSCRDSYSLIAAAITLVVIIAPCVRLCLLKPSKSNDPDA